MCQSPGAEMLTGCPEEDKGQIVCQPQSNSEKGQQDATVWAIRQTCIPQYKLSIYTLTTRVQR